MIMSKSSKSKLLINWTKPFRDLETLMHIVEACPERMVRELNNDVYNFEGYYDALPKDLYLMPKSVSREEVIWNFQMVILAMWRRIPESCPSNEMRDWKNFVMDLLLKESGRAKLIKNPKELRNDNFNYKGDEGLGDMDAFEGQYAIKPSDYKEGKAGFIYLLNETCKKYDSVYNAFADYEDPYMLIKKFMKIHYFDRTWISTHELWFLYSIMDFPIMFLEATNKVGNWVAMNWIDEFPWESETKGVDLKKIFDETKGIDLKKKMEKLEDIKTGKEEYSQMKEWFDDLFG